MAPASVPRFPFPYYAEAWTGLEYQAAATMIYAGMVREGVEAFENSRRRYDGERRNPWDEAECGHHYARAMSAWSGVLALSGFRYHARGEDAPPSRRALKRAWPNSHASGRPHLPGAHSRTPRIADTAA